ncbi:MAG: hypothetical protein E5W64_12070, partial [Mesorhizobium sp.]
MDGDAVAGLAVAEVDDGRRLVVADLDHRRGGHGLLEGLAYAVLVESTIASGKVRAIDSKAAEAAPGVLKVLTPDTIISLRTASDWFGTPPPDRPY